MEQEASVDTQVSTQEPAVIESTSPNTVATTEETEQKVERTWQNDLFDYVKENGKHPSGPIEYNSIEEVLADIQKGKDYDRQK